MEPDAAAVASATLSDCFSSLEEALLLLETQKELAGHRGLVSPELSAAMIPSAIISSTDQRQIPTKRKLFHCINQLRLASISVLEYSLASIELQ